MLSEETKNEKALFRRGKARAALGQSDAAKEDLKKAQKISPSDHAVANALRQIQKEEREGRNEQRKMFEGMFKEESRSDEIERKATVGIGHRLIELWVLIFGCMKQSFGFLFIPTRLKRE